MNMKLSDLLVNMPGCERLRDMLKMDEGYLDYCRLTGFLSALMWIEYLTSDQYLALTAEAREMCKKKNGGVLVGELKVMAPPDTRPKFDEGLEVGEQGFLRDVVVELVKSKEDFPEISRDILVEYSALHTAANGLCSAVMGSVYKALDRRQAQMAAVQLAFRLVRFASRLDSYAGWRFYDFTPALNMIGRVPGVSVIECVGEGGVRSGEIVMGFMLSLGEAMQSAEGFAKNWEELLVADGCVLGAVEVHLMRVLEGGDLSLLAMRTANGWEVQ